MSVLYQLLIKLMIVNPTRCSYNDSVIERLSKVKRISGGNYMVNKFVEKEPSIPD